MKRIFPVLIAAILIAAAFACTDEPAAAVDATPAPIQTEPPVEVIIDDVTVPVTELKVLSESEMPDIETLAAMTSLRLLDLTALPYTPSEEIAEISLNCPNCQILWNQKLTDGIFRSDSASLTLPNATAEDVRLLEVFSNLVFVDATGSREFAALHDFKEAHPSVEVHYSMTLGDTVVTDSDTAIVVPSGVDVRQFISDLHAFEHIESVDLCESGWNETEMQLFLSAYPQMKVHRMISIGGQSFDSDAQMLDLRALQGQTPEQLAETLRAFPNLNTVALPASWSEQQINSVLSALPGVTVIGPVTAFGQTFDGVAEEIDLSKTKLSSTEEVEALLAKLPFLTKCVMCDCGLNDQQMEQLCSAHPGVKFVWIIEIGKRKLRTDAIGFSTKNPSKYTNPNSSDKYNESVKKAVRLREGDIEALKYCTDLEALDLGHNYLTNNDLLVISKLTKLKVLILADNKITDISVLTTLKDLEYIELFMNKIPDLSPLCEMPNLRDVNVCNTGASDLTPLFQLTGAKRLWYAMNPFSREQAKALKEALPDCVCNYTTRDETGEGWREDPRYHWMRAYFQDS